MGQAVGPGRVAVSAPIPHEDRRACVEVAEQLRDHVGLVPDAGGIQAVRRLHSLAETGAEHVVEVGARAVRGDPQALPEVVQADERGVGSGHESHAPGLEQAVLLLGAGLHDRAPLRFGQIREESPEALFERQAHERHPLGGPRQLTFDSELRERAPRPGAGGLDPEAIRGDQRAVQVEQNGIEQDRESQLVTRPFFRERCRMRESSAYGTGQLQT